jgi:hypothetical protein
MNPTLPELLMGNVMAVSEPPPPEAMGDFLTSKITVIAMISLLGAQEAEKGVAVTVAENRRLRELFARAAQAWDAKLGGRLAEAAKGEDADLRVSILDAANAQLREVLIALHEAVEAETSAQARALDAEIIALYGEMARARRLDLPPMSAT